ncbi:MAG: electron transport complex subunit RsxE [Gemmatimonadota bacterium]
MTDPTATAPQVEPFVPGAPPPAPPWLDLWRGVARDNPVLVQMLGLCPAMAVSNSLANGIAMGIATMFVLTGSSLLISLVRKSIAGEVRLTSYILIIATFVTVADLLLAASFPGISKALGPFVPLIVVNCIILGRAEAFAGKVAPLRALADGIGMGLGFTLVMSLISAVRELLGSGSLLGVKVLGPHFEPWVIMVLPPGGFLTLGIIFLVMGWHGARQARRAKEART